MEYLLVACAETERSKKTGVCKCSHLLTRGSGMCRMDGLQKQEVTGLIPACQRALTRRSTPVCKFLPWISR